MLVLHKLSFSGKTCNLIKGNQSLNNCVKISSWIDAQGTSMKYITAKYHTDMISIEIKSVLGACCTKYQMGYTKISKERWKMYLQKLCKNVNIIFAEFL